MDSLERFLKKFRVRSIFLTGFLRCKWLFNCQIYYTGLFVSCRFSNSGHLLQQLIDPILYTWKIFHSIRAALGMQIYSWPCKYTKWTQIHGSLINIQCICLVLGYKIGTSAETNFQGTFHFRISAWQAHYKCSKLPETHLLESSHPPPLRPCHSFSHCKTSLS